MHPALSGLELRDETPEPSDGSCVLHLSGELDLCTAELLRARLADLPTAAAPHLCLVLDLAALEFVDVAGLDVVLEADRRLRASGGRVVLRAPSALLRRVLHLLRVDLAVEP